MRKVCCVCQVDVSQTQRHSNSRGQYYCKLCWKRVTQGRANGDSPSRPLAGTRSMREQIISEPEETQVEAEFSIQDLSLAPTDLNTSCRVCGNFFPLHEMPEGNAVCRRCQHARTVKLIRLAAAAALVVIVGLGMLVIFTGKKPVDPPDHSSPQVAHSPAVSNPTVNKIPIASKQDPPPLAVPATDLKPVRPAAPVGVGRPQTQTELENVLKDHTSVTVAAKKQDYAELIRLYAQRQQLLESASIGDSALVNQWIEDQKLIKQARALVDRTQYDKAINLLKSRIRQREKEVPFNGDLAVEMVRASLAAVVVEGRWVLQSGEMQLALDQVARLDPANVIALVMRSWLISSNPKEELLRLDLRDSVVERNRRLLPIRTSLVSSTAGYEDPDNRRSLGGFQDFLKHAAAKTTMPLSQFRAVIAPLEFCLGQSRLPVLEETQLWREMLTLHSATSLVDAAGNRYQLTRGHLWKQTSGKDGVEWQLLIPPAYGVHAPGADWTPYSMRLVRWISPDNNDQDDDKLKSVLHQLEQAKELNVPDFRPRQISGYRLVAYSSREVTPYDLDELDVPSCQLPLDLIAAGFNLSIALEKKEKHGTCLAFKQLAAPRIDPFWNLALEHYTDEPPRPQGTPKGIDAAPYRGTETPPKQWVLIKRSPLIKTMVRQPTITIDLFVDATDPESPYFRANDAKVYLRPDHILTLRTPGGGWAARPLEHSRFIESDMRIAAQRVLLQKPQPAAPLLELITNHGRKGNETIEQLLVKAIMPSEACVINKPRQMEEREWSDYVNAYYKHGRELRKLLCATPFGFDARGRMVLSGNESLAFLDSAGKPLDQFYTFMEASKLWKDCSNDFLYPSLLTVPAPFIPRSLTDFGLDQWLDDRGETKVPEGLKDPYSADFMLQRAEQAKTAQNLHLAATLYGEAPIPIFSFQPFDSTRPPDRDEMLGRTNSMTVTALGGQKKSEIRLRLAEVLRDAALWGGPQREMVADEILRTTRAEWQLCGLPLLKEMKRYSEAYGYAPRSEFSHAASALATLVEAGPVLSEVEIISNEDVTFDSAAALAHFKAKTLDAYLAREFYDRRPTLEQYCIAKQWLLKNAPRFRYRAPRSEFDFLLSSWKPVNERHGKPQSIDDGEVFRIDRQSDSLTAAWLRLRYESETRPSARPDELGGASTLRLRQLCLHAAGAQRQMAASASPTALSSLLANLNALGLFALATATDIDLPPQYRLARFDEFTHHAMLLELKSFIAYRLLAAGLDRHDTNLLVEPTITLIRSVPRGTHDSASERYYWSEYAPLVDSYLTFRTRATSSNVE